eukprot:351434-Alexandrium_andersonii.AAC.1
MSHPKLANCLACRSKLPMARDAPRPANASKVGDDDGAVAGSDSATASDRRGDEQVRNSTDRRAMPTPAAKESKRPQICRLTDPM